MTNSSTDNQEQGCAKRFLIDGTALNRVLDEAPYLSRCSDNKTATLIRPRNCSINYPYMQINRSGFVSWLIFDLDHDNPLVWEDEGLPPPNLIVSDRKSRHSHLYYAIVPVCTTENARPKPISYMKAIYTAFALKLNADSDYHSGPVAKTPGHVSWHTEEIHSQVYELGELADYVDLELGVKWGKQPNLDKVSHSRHCTLFEHLRHFAYSIVNSEREIGSFKSFKRRLEAYAHDKNNFKSLGFNENLPQSSIKSTVKSVSRWTWDFYVGSGRCNLGVMQLDQSLPIAERQRLAALRTHEERHKATELKILSACRLLRAKGEELTQLSIAAISGIARQTVAAYKHLLNEVLTQKVKGDNSFGCDVKYATYQVTAPVPKARKFMQFELFTSRFDTILVGDG